MLLGEIDVEVAVVAVVGVVARAGFRITVIEDDLRHGNGDASVGNPSVITAWRIRILWAVVVVILGLVPIGMEQRGDDNLRGGSSDGRVAQLFPSLFHPFTGNGLFQAGCGDLLPVLGQKQVHTASGIVHVHIIGETVGQHRKNGILCRKNQEAGVKMQNRQINNAVALQILAVFQRVGKRVRTKRLCFQMKSLHPQCHYLVFRQCVSVDEEGEEEQQD